MKIHGFKIYLAVLSTVVLVISPALAAESAFIGKPAPSFSLKTINGDGVTMESLKGKGVVLNFWATWCAPCKAEMPALEEAYKKHGGSSFTVIGVNYQQETPAVKRYLKKSAVSFPIVMDTDGVLSKKYAVLGLPSAFFIDRNGIVVGSHVGALKPEMLQEWTAKLTAP